MINTKDLTKTFRRGMSTVHAVECVNVTINAGERVYIHGPSGAGKSTLLYMLGGLSRPTKGSVSLHDRNIYRGGDRKRSEIRNRKFGFIFQFYRLLSELSVRENVMLPTMIKGGESRKIIATKAEKLLEAVGMTDRLKHKPNQLSGGEIQRVAIARALINSPEVLFCDEPTGNLGSKMSSEIYNLIYDISKMNNMSVVVVSHQDINEGFADSEYLMVDGKIEQTSDVRHQTSDQNFPLEGFEKGLKSRV